jgi:multisubunit Na+/H+ antiporter MnhG subunit
VKAVEASLVGLGIALELACCAGLLVMRNAFDRLHYASAASTVPPLVIAAAVLLEQGWTAAGINALVVALLLAVLNAVLVNATARVARLRRHGTLEPSASELERGR